MSKPAGESVLAKLTASVMTEKKAAASKLTPVAGEGYVAVPKLPNDTGVFMSNEALHDHAKELRRFAANALAIADGIDKMTGQSSDPEAVAPDPAIAQKQKEQEADAKIAALQAETEEVIVAQDENDEDVIEVIPVIPVYEDLQREAQESVFGPTTVTVNDDGTADVAEPVWECPIHHKPGITKTSQKSGREFIGCPDCNAFAR